MIEMLTRLVDHSVSLLAADAAGLLVADSEKTLLLVAASSEDARTLELLQLQAEQGPCVECFHTGVPVSVVDLRQAAHRWPRFTALASRRHNFASVHALPLRLRGEIIGTLNLLHRNPGALPPDDLVLGQALADIATIAIVQQRTIRRGQILTEQLQTALENRVVIEQAIPRAWRAAWEEFTPFLAYPPEIRKVL